MTYVKSDAKGFCELSIPALSLNRGILVLHGDITTESANKFIQRLLVFCMEKPKALVKVLLTTNGGNIDAGMLIYDALKSCPNPVYTYALEKAYSMGVIILMAGQKNFMLPNTKLMIHKPWTNEVQGTSDDLTARTKILKRYEEKLISILTEKTGKEVKEIKKAVGYDHFFSAEEALAYGLIDDIVGIDHVLGTEVEYEA